MSEKLSNDLNIFNSLAQSLIEDEDRGVVNQIDPKELLKTFNISLEDNPITDEKLKESLNHLILNTPKTNGNLFFNQLFGGLNSKAVLGDLLAVILNNSMATYKISGPMVEIEKEILRKIAEMISYPETSAGTIPTGGSMSNFMALVMARDKKNPESKHSGDNNKLICYSSKSSHYSMDKNASFSGIGRNNVRYIETNKKGEMISSELISQIEQDIKNGLTPFFINATIGTTVMGAIDPIIEIAEICKKYNIWLHLDGAYGGSVIFSEKYKHLVKGIEHSDSFCFNPHKTLGTPISTSILLVKEGGNLLNSFSNKANYLYQTDGDEYNLGQTSFECGRRNNALKFWTLWKSVGTKGISEMVDHSYSLADTAREYVKNNSDYTIYSFENSLSICFNYKDIDPKKLCTDLYLKNKLMVGYGEHKGETFIRLVTINRENTTEDILNFFKILEKFTESEIYDR